jgi:carboxypeptidase family protein
MKARLVLWLVLGALVLAPAISFGQQPGEIFGKVTDTSGAVMPGVTVTLTSPVLLQPVTAVASETGSYRFPQLAVGVYAVKFELAGFRTVIYEGIRIEIGFNAQINAQLEVSAVQETVTVTGESPVVDTRDTGRGSRFNQEALQAIPSARDPWVIIEQAAGVAMDRSNVGGSQSGQQSNFVARGAAMAQQKWNLDGVDITDMAATGGSPVYFDFDAFEEMQISTGGADVSMQSPGVAVNLVTKSGTDQFKGSTRYYVTDDTFQSINVTDDLRRQGATTGNPIQNIKDYGIEAGGPIVRGKAWIWGSYSKQDVNVGINNFYKPTAECQAMRASPLSYSIEDVRTCLNSDSTVLNNYNAKFAISPFRNNQASMFYNAAEKVRNARDASDLRPLETTYRQMGVSPEAGLGSRWWKTGMPKSYKWADRQIFTDRLMLEASYAHVGNNFELAFHEDSLRDVQPLYNIDTQEWSRSYQDIIYVRPTDSVDVTASYFVPGFLKGDHSIKMGLKIRQDGAYSESVYGGNAYARIRKNGPFEAQIYRTGRENRVLFNRNFYLQDSYVRGRMTAIVGVRFDYQTDTVDPMSIEAGTFYGQPTYVGQYCSDPKKESTCAQYSGKIFDQLPAISFGGAKALGDRDHAFVDWSPRVGFSYDLTGNGRNVLKFNYARYVGQLGGNSGLMSVRYNPVGQTYVRYPWVDVNKDGFIQANEVVYTANPLDWTTGYNYRDPLQLTTTGTVDPDLTNDKTDEIIASFDRQIGKDFGVSASYIWRKYTNFRGIDLSNFGADNWTEVSWTPSCPAGATCPGVTYYQPTSQIPTAYVYTNIEDFWRGYQGFELTARKRFSNSWQINGSYSYNDAPMHFDSPAGYVWWSNRSDPTNIENALNHGQYAEQSTTSGIDNVYVNASWIARLSGSYMLPWWRISVAAFYNARSGYPYIRSVQTPTRPFSAGQTDVFLDRRGDERLPNFQSVDFRIDKPFTFFRRFKATGSIDVFNAMNANTALSIRGRQNASNANTISALLAPRVVRFGVRATW